VGVGVGVGGWGDGCVVVYTAELLHPADTTHYLSHTILCSKQI